MTCTVETAQFKNLNSITALKYHVLRRRRRKKKKKHSRLSQRETINFASEECGFSKGTWCKNGLFFHPRIEAFISISTSFWQKNSGSLKMCQARNEGWCQFDLRLPPALCWVGGENLLGRQSGKTLGINFPGHSIALTKHSSGGIYQAA